MEDSANVTPKPCENANEPLSPWPKQGREWIMWKDEMCGQIIAHTDVSPFQKLVALAILRRVNRETGEAWPSHATIASAVGGSGDGVKSAIRALVKKGLLDIKPGLGRRKTSRYRVLEKGCGHTDKRGAATPPNLYIRTRSRVDAGSRQTQAPAKKKKVIGHSIRPKLHSSQKSIDGAPQAPSDSANKSQQP